MSNNNEKVKQDHHLHQIFLILYLVGVALFLASLFIEPLKVVKFAFPSNYLLIPLYVLMVLLMGVEIVFEATMKLLKALIKEKKFLPDIHLLMSLGVLGAFIIGKYIEGVLLFLIFGGAHFLEDLVSKRSSANIEKLLKLTPPKARLISADGTIEIVSSESLLIDDEIKVLPGDVIARDGVIISGISEIDEAIITGEDLPKLKTVDEEVYAGTINYSGTLIVKINKTEQETILAKIVKMVKETKTSYTKTALIIKKIEPIFVSVVLIIAPLFYLAGLFLFKWGYHDSFIRTIVLLIGASPCALAVTDIPATLSALSFLAKKGIIFKSGDILANVSEIDVIAFDKTGTLTVGKPELNELLFSSEVKEEEKAFYEQIIYSLEYQANHPLARAVMNYFKDQTNLDLTVINEIGIGVKANYDNHLYSLLKADGNLAKELKEREAVFLKLGKTVVYFKKDNKTLALLAFSDEIDEGANDVISYFNNADIKTVLITGDNKKTALEVQNKLKIAACYSDVLPEEKAAIIKTLQKNNQSVLMVGDGINDAVALKSADIGISMGDGTDIAIEVSDGVLVKNDLSKLSLIHRVSKRLKRVVLENIIFALGVVVLLFILNIFGLMKMSYAVVIHEGSTLLVILSGLRLLVENY